MWRTVAAGFYIFHSKANVLPHPIQTASLLQVQPPQPTGQPQPKRPGKVSSDTWCHMPATIYHALAPRLLMVTQQPCLYMPADPFGEGLQPDELDAPCAETP